MTKFKKIMGVQQVLLCPTKEVEAVLQYLCRQSGKLYNSGVYLARQIFFKTGRLLTGKFDVRIQVLDWGTREGMKKPQEWADIASRKKAIALLP